MRPRVRRMTASMSASTTQLSTFAEPAARVPPTSVASTSPSGGTCRCGGEHRRHRGDQQQFDDPRLGQPDVGGELVAQPVAGRRRRGAAGRSRPAGTACRHGTAAASSATSAPGPPAWLSGRAELTGGLLGSATSAAGGSRSNRSVTGDRTAVILRWSLSRPGSTTRGRSSRVGRVVPAPPGTQRSTPVQLGHSPRY